MQNVSRGDHFLSFGKRHTHSHVLRVSEILPSAIFVLLASCARGGTPPAVGECSTGRRATQSTHTHAEKEETQNFVMA